MSPRRFVGEEIDFLSLVSARNRRRLLEGSTRAVLPAGAIAYHPEAPDIAFVLEAGLARIYWGAPDGRQATVLSSTARKWSAG